MCACAQCARGLLVRAYLSVRIPDDLKAKLKEKLAHRGQSLQAHVLDLLIISGCDSDWAASLPQVLKILRSQKADLTQRHVRHLWVFGSVARGEDGPESDVDLLVEFDLDAKVSLTGVSRLRLDLSNLLGRPVDLAEWRTLRPHAMASAQDDAIQVF